MADARDNGADAEDPLKGKKKRGKKKKKGDSAFGRVRTKLGKKNGATDGADPSATSPKAQSRKDDDAKKRVAATAILDDEKKRGLEKRGKKPKDDKQAEEQTADDELRSPRARTAPVYATPSKEDIAIFQTHNFHEVGPKEVILFKQVGEAAFSTTWRARCRSQEVACRVLNKQDYSSKIIKEFRQEIITMSNIRNPNIVLFLGACTVSGNLCIVTEWMPLDLKTLLIKEKREYSLHKRMKMARGAALGILWLHRSNPPMTHNHIHLSNFMVGNDENVKICDFGLPNMRAMAVQSATDARKAKQNARLVYQAPEFLKGGDYNERCDVYSFGMALYEISTGAPVFPKLRRKLKDSTDPINDVLEVVEGRGERPDLSFSVASSSLSTTTSSSSITLSPGIAGGDDSQPTNQTQQQQQQQQQDAFYFPPRLIDLITSCWAADPAKRPLMSEIIDRLNELIVETAIDDPVAQRLWQESFVEKTEVPWTKLVEALSRLFMVEGPTATVDEEEMETHWRCMYSLVARRLETTTDKVPMVSIEDFGSNLAWFGPLVPFTGTSYFTKLRRTLQQAWFHGDITAEESEDMLNDRDPGSFLVRFSSKPGRFTISGVNRKRKIVHSRVIYDPFSGLYLFGDSSYTSLNKLIEAEKEACFFKTPCPGSRFAKIFSNSRSGHLVRPQGEYLIPQMGGGAEG